MFALLLTVVILLVWIERKVVADMQNRIGPDRAGPWGILQTVADGLKLIFKESMTPRKVEFALYIAAPIAALVPALLIFLVVPIGRPFTLGDRVISFRAPISTSACSTSWRSPRWRSTPWSWPAGRPGRSTRCSVRCGPPLR